MALPAPIFQLVHAVFQLPSVSRDPAKDEIFIEVVKQEFPNLLSRQQLPLEALAAPHLVLASTSSQLAVSAAQVDFEVRFYGEYEKDVSRGVEYVQKKLGVVLAGLEACELPPVTLGVVGSLRFPFTEDGEKPAYHVASHLLRTAVDEADLQDAMSRVAIRLRDTYFLTLTVSNYESRIYERPAIAGIAAAIVRPWEGTVNETGIELSVDINNILEARESPEPVVVTTTGVEATTRLLREVITRVGPAFVESAELPVADITEISKL